MVSLALASAYAPGCGPEVGGIDPGASGSTSTGGKSTDGGAQHGGTVSAKGGHSAGGAMPDAGAGWSAGGDSMLDAGAPGAGEASSGGRASGGTTSTGGASSGGGHHHPQGAADSGGQPNEGGAPHLGGAGGEGGSGGEGGTMTAPLCVYHTDALQAGSGNEDAGGAGGAGPVYTLKSQKSGFVGQYLVDANGRALYAYGADSPGDCENPPITTCFNDCLIAWPPFDGEPRVLGPGLDDGLFGSMLLDDGTRQTTYRGWPLYYYKNDLAPGDVKGQAVGRIWWLAQLVLPNVVVMRAGSARFLGDGDGFALYVSSADTVGVNGKRPVSACSGDCLDSYAPFSPPYVSPVSFLVPQDLTTFIRADGTTQLAYKGAPLYRSSADVRSGTMNGVSPDGWALAVP